MKAQSVDINEIVSYYTQEIVEMMIDTPPKLTHKEVAFGDIKKHYNELLFYTTSKNSDNVALQLEQQIVVGLAAIHAVADNKLSLKTTDGQSLAHTPLLETWCNIVVLVDEHKQEFKSNYHQKEHYFTNFYLNNLEQQIIDAAEVIAKKVNETVPHKGEGLTAENLLYTNVHTTDTTTGETFTCPSILQTVTDKSSLN
ncbi:MAG TPA: hypothetical protein DCL21_02175 [Alphaproteobacteria bacterium]|nr:hypothetical protein [Alphaproteobacteria bacterium]